MLVDSYPRLNDKSSREPLPVPYLDAPSNPSPWHSSQQHQLLHAARRSGAERYCFDVGSAGKSVRQSRHESTTQILVEQELHPAAPEANRRSRAAAKA